MRDAARDVRPRRAALIEQLLRDIVEGQDRPRIGPRDPDGKRPRLAAAHDLNDRLTLATRHQIGEFGRDKGQRLPDDAVDARADQFGRRIVGDPDRAVFARGDHARRHAGHHRLDERTAAVELIVCGDQRAILLLQPPGHSVERIGQRADLIQGAGIGYARRQITVRDTSRRTYKLAQRTNETVGNGQRDPHRKSHNQQRNAQQCGVEPQLQCPRTRLHVPVVCNEFLAALPLLDHPGVKNARHVEIGTLAVL